MLKKSIPLISTVILGLFSFSQAASAAPSTKGRIGLGGQLGLGGMPAAISLRIGLSDSFKLNAMTGFRFAPNNISVSVGGQAEFAITTAKKDLLPYFGAGVYFGISPTGVSIDLAPLLGFEYFLTPEFTFDASLGLPISMSLPKGAAFSFGGISTYVNPVFGFHYYF